MPTAPDITLDAACDKVATGTAVHVCTAEPADHAGIAAVSVGNYVTTAGDGLGDWVVENGATSGRQIRLNAQSGNNGTATGAGLYIAVTDGTNLLWVADGDGDTVNNGSAFSIPQTPIVEWRDPTNI